MASDITICNLALAHLGTATISALTDASKEARACKLHYEEARDAVLREHPWNFATRRVYLALLSVAPVGYDFAYAYPTDCLFAREIWQETELLAPTPFEVVSGTSGRMVVTDEADAVLEYTARVTDSAQFDPLFVQALSYRLAAEIAMPITRSVTVAQAMLNLYRNSVAMATTIDGREGKTDPEHPNSYIQARL